MADRIAMTIAAHDEGNPVTMWDMEDWPEASVEEFLSLVPDQLHRSLGKAWEAASEGSVSGSGCSGLFMGMGSRLANEATQSDDLSVSMQGIDGCHVAVTARYLSVRLDPDAPAPDGCIAEMVAVNGLRMIAGSLLRDADPEDVILEYLDSRLDAVSGELVRAACPDMASIILGASQ